VLSLERLYQSLTEDRRNQLLNRLREGPWERLRQKATALRIKPEEYDKLERRFNNVTDGSANVAGYQEIFTSIIS